MHLLRHALVVGALLLATACGGGGGTTAPDNNNHNPPGGPGGNTQTLGSITTSTSSLNLTAGQSSTITVVALDTQGAAISGASPGFSTADEAVAAVGTDGTVTAISAGNTMITVSVSLGGVTKSAEVAVAVSGTPPATATVVGSPNYYFTPGTVVISAGGTVTWQFGAVAHTVTFTGGGAGTPGDINATADAQVDRTFNTAGTYTYICSIHAGMSGRVIVR